MANEGERLMKVEMKVENLDKDIHGDEGLSRRLRELEKTIWKATGAFGVFYAIINYFKH